MIIVLDSYFNKDVYFKSDSGAVLQSVVSFEEILIDSFHNTSHLYYGVELGNITNKIYAKREWAEQGFYPCRQIKYNRVRISIIPMLSIVSFKYGERLTQGQIVSVKVKISKNDDIFNFFEIIDIEYVVKSLVSDKTMTVCAENIEKYEEVLG